MIVEVNPFPATMGRICPHPCESNCNRITKDGAVSINALERFLGDWAIDRGLSLPLLKTDRRIESVGVVGAGPSGLSFAYQMARRGYSVTVYEENPEAGGMLRYGIPEFRLPRNTLSSEIQRILDLGVELRANTAIGKDVSVEEVRSLHPILYLGIGAQKGRLLGLTGEKGPGVWTGIGYLKRANRNLEVDLGKTVVVVGGGDTAIDAARVARRTGAQVTILYRRTRKEMPAIDAEVEDALSEQIEIRFLETPVRIKREGESIRSVVVLRMELGEPDTSGRPRPVPIEGSEYELPVDSVIVAVSQQADWENLGELCRGDNQIGDGGAQRIDSALWSGGDVLGLGIASRAIAHGRQAAEQAHAGLCGLDPTLLRPNLEDPITAESLRSDCYERKEPTEVARGPGGGDSTLPAAQLSWSMNEEQFLLEISRCFSCGLCFGCERCWMYCNPTNFERLSEVQPGAYYALSLDRCEGCGKCIEVCPCGFLSVTSSS